MSTDPLAVVPLHTGQRLTKAIALNSFIMLRTLAARNPTAVVDLALWLEDPEHVMDEQTLKAIPYGWEMGPSMSKDTLIALRASLAGSVAAGDLRVINPFTGE